MWLQTADGSQSPLEPSLSLEEQIQYWEDGYAEYFIEEEDLQPLHALWLQIQALRAQLNQAAVKQ